MKQTMQLSHDQEDLKNNVDVLLVSLQKECFSDVNVTHSIILPNSTSNVTDSNLFCHRTFDGWNCWDETPAGTTVFQHCPDFVVGLDPRRPVFKRCTENGTWSVHPNTSEPWTNYTTCIDDEDINFRYMINEIYIAGYSISLVALLLSLILFVYFRSLKCTRIRIHMQLFSSIIINNIFWIIWYKTVVNEVAVVQHNKVWCQIVHIATNYFMLSSYFWIFSEGLHLHNLLVVVFVKNDVAMRWFNALGWGLSLIITIIYTIVRYSTPGQIERCWIDDTDAFWIIIVPVIISLVASFVFMVKVVWVICTKVHPVRNQRFSLSFRRAARAALILIPLFGLHFMLIPFRPSVRSPAEKTYQVVLALMTSLQGVCVAILFCFTNHDILNAIKLRLAQLFRTSEAIPMTGMTGVTGGRSLVNTREHAV